MLLALVVYTSDSLKSGSHPVLALGGKRRSNIAKPLFKLMSILRPGGNITLGLDQVWGPFQTPQKYRGRSRNGILLSSM
jgi:hypothetical protein